MQIDANKFKILSVAILVTCCTAYLIQDISHSSDTHVNDANSPIQLSERSKSKEVKKEWLELIHRAPDGVDWRVIENKNRLNIYEDNKPSLLQPRSNSVEIADGVLIGRWKEKGSRNLSGSVLKTAYSKNSNTLYALADGGTIWQTDPTGETWTIVNDQLKFDHKNLEVIDIDGTDRIIASIGGQAYYSDDGYTWEKSDGFYGSDLVLDRLVKYGQNEELFALARLNLQIKLIHSNNNGKSFDVVHHFPTENFEDIALSLTGDKKNLFVFYHKVQTNKSFLYSWQTNDQSLYKESEFIGETEYHDISNLSVSKQNNNITLYRYDKFSFVFQSIDLGKSWERLNYFLPAKPWNIGLYNTSNIYISEINPDFMIYGGVELHTSVNGGETWKKQNSWTEYYHYPDTKLHADIMHVGEYKDQLNNTFFVISTHGGVYTSFNNLGVVKNISKDGLNISQYYDAKSYPGSGNWIFGAAQDQGIQRTWDIEEVPNVFQQITPGDYGHISFIEKEPGDFEMWLSYPEGTIYHYPDPLVNIADGKMTPNSYSIPANSKQQSVWLQPITPNPQNQSVLMAGGNIYGGAGSYIIELKSENNDDIIVDQWLFNFGEDRIKDGEISAIAINHFDPSIYYVSTTYGKFFKSIDGGIKFTKQSITGPTANFLYGTGIYPSKVFPNIIYLCGSGYGNAPIYRSTDDGETFHPFSQGMPPTTVFKIDGNLEESLLFAATESGPYVYIRDNNKWYHMSQMAAPNQAYWSVEYNEEKNLARFGTYGRGIWDFKIDFYTSTEEINSNYRQLQTYPNPVQDVLSINIDDVENIDQFSIYSMNGNYIFGENSKVSSRLQIPVDQLSTGVYFIQVRIKDQYYINKFVKI